MADLAERPYTVASLAERWGCSPDAVYALIKAVSRDATASCERVGYEDQEEGITQWTKN